MSLVCSLHGKPLINKEKAFWRQEKTIQVAGVPGLKEINGGFRWAPFSFSPQSTLFIQEAVLPKPLHSEKCKEEETDSPRQSFEHSSLGVHTNIFYIVSSLCVHVLLSSIAYFLSFLITFYLSSLVLSVHKRSKVQHLFTLVKKFNIYSPFLWWFQWECPPQAQLLSPRFPVSRCYWGRFSTCCLAVGRMSLEAGFESL